MTTILIVDDEAGTLLLLQSLLKSNGYAVKTAGDGASALEIVKAGGIDITVTDLRMEPMDGMALFREIRKVTNLMPVIILTGYASIGTAIDAMKSGVFDYLTKPFKVDDMLVSQARVRAGRPPERGERCRKARHAHARRAPRHRGEEGCGGGGAGGHRHDNGGCPIARRDRQEGTTP